MSVAKGMAEIAKLITPAIEKALGRGATKQSKAALTRAANKAGMSTEQFKGIAKKILKDKVKPGKKPKYPSLESLGKPKAKNPKPAKPAGKLSREVGRLKKQQEADAAGMARKKRERELMPIAAFKESNPLERKAGAGSGADVAGKIMRGQAITKEQIKELEDMDKAGAIGFQITGKRAGGKVRGTGAATRGFGKAGYSYKNM
jgi:hypothetical protein